MKRIFKYMPIDIATDERFQMERIISLLSLIRVSTRIPSNGNLIYRCPLCGDSSNLSHGHLYIDLINNNYYCAKCGESGKALSLYAKCNGIDNKTAFKELLGSELTKKDRKKIHNMKLIKKTIEKNKEKCNTALAGINRRNRVYKALYSELTLYENHRINLLKRGLTDEFIKYMGYKSIPENFKERRKIAYKLIKQGYKLNGVPGFFKDKQNNWTFTGASGYLIPVIDNQGRIQGFQIRRFVEKGKYIWFSSSGKKEGTASETFINFTGSNKNKPFVIVEGVLKSQVCSYLKPTANYIGIPGTFAIRLLIHLLKENNIKNVFIAFDMDKLNNKYVLKAETNLKNKLKENNINYQIFNWSLSKGKGLDDFLLNVILSKRIKNDNICYNY